MKKSHLAIGAITVASVLGLAAVPGSAPEPGFSNHMHFRKDQLTTLKWAAEDAAWCGGEVIIDRDDQEILVGGCDK